MSRQGKIERWDGVCTVQYVEEVSVGRVCIRPVKDGKLGEERACTAARDFVMGGKTQKTRSGCSALMALKLGSLEVVVRGDDLRVIEDAKRRQIELNASSEGQLEAQAERWGFRGLVSLCGRVFFPLLDRRG